MIGVSDDLAAARRAEYLTHCQILAELPGAASLIAQYEHPPSFHDSTLEEINLSMGGTSILRLANPHPTIFDSGRLFVTFEIQKVIDLNLDFYGENILFGLLLRPPIVRGDRSNNFTRPLVEGDIEFQFEPTCGVGGYLIGREVSVRWTKNRRARNAQPDIPSVRR